MTALSLVPVMILFAVDFMMMLGGMA